MPFSPQGLHEPPEHWRGRALDEQGKASGGSIGFGALGLRRFPRPVDRQPQAFADFAGINHGVGSLPGRQAGDSYSIMPRPRTTIAAGRQPGFHSSGGLRALMGGHQSAQERLPGTPVNPAARIAAATPSAPG